MTQNKTAEEKIAGILECIKKQRDLSPKGSYSTHSHFGYSYQHPEGEVRLDTGKLMSAGGVDYFELEKILARLREDGLILKFETIADNA
jgi:hypothetical protein